MEMSFSASQSSLVPSNMHSGRAAWMSKSAKESTRMAEAVRGGQCSCISPMIDMVWTKGAGKAKHVGFKKFLKLLHLIAAQKGIEDDNADVEAKSTMLERQVQKRREDLLLSQTKHQEFTDELEVLKNELASSATALMKKRNDNATTAKVLEEKHLALAVYLANQFAQTGHARAPVALDDASGSGNVVLLGDSAAARDAWTC